MEMQVTNLVNFAIDCLKSNYVDKENGGVFDLPQIAGYSPTRRKKLFYNAVCAIGLSYYTKELNLFKKLIDYLETLSGKYHDLVPAWEEEEEQTLGEQGLLLWALSRGYQILQKKSFLSQCRKMFSKIEKYVDTEGMPHFPDSRYFAPMSTAFCLDALVEYQAIEPTSQGERIIKHLVGCLEQACYPPVFQIKINGKFLSRLTFNNIVYPIHALSRYSVIWGDDSSKSLIEESVERLLQLQGNMGQWWWYYSKFGKIVEKYPVFSVHQHGMAIMALEAAKPLVSKDVIVSIDRATHLSFEWVLGKNEVSKSMIDEEKNLIFRSLQYPFYDNFGASKSKIKSKLIQPLCILGLDKHLLRINPLCRSYEFGWLLYATHLQSEFSL